MEALRQLWAMNGKFFMLECFVIGLALSLAICSTNTSSSTTPTTRMFTNMSNISTTTTTTFPVTLSNLSTAPHGVTEDEVAEKIAHQSMTFFAVLVILFTCVIVISFLLNKKVHFIPEALAVMVLGTCTGVIIKYVISKIGVNVGKWQDVESFQPESFFLVLLPPIIFESGYTLQKGDFFSNIGAILTYALLGTLVSAVIVGITMYFLGRVGIVFKLEFMEANSIGRSYMWRILASYLVLLQWFSFGSLISATDPVCTLALFQSMNVDQDLYAIVFGESVLNDAVSIVLTITLVSAARKIEKGNVVYSSIASHAISKFCLMLFVSSLIGVVFGLLSAIVFKYINIRNHPSLEIALMIIFAYMPYGISEGLELSGIMAILLCGITMSHYTHFNLSPLTQISVQQLFRCIALVAETLVFLFLGMSIFGAKHVFDYRFVCLAMIVCLIARAFVVFPLSLFFIFCRRKENRVSLKVLFLVWFSGLRGAVAFAQSLHLPLANKMAQKMIMTTTLSITVFTNVILGGFTLPLVKFFGVESGKSRAKLEFVSKSKELGKIVGPPKATRQMSQYRERKQKGPMSIIRGWRRFDRNYLMPFFIREPDSKDYQLAVEHMLGHWAENEERTVGLLSSAEFDEFSPILVTRTRRNIVRPVRKALRAVDPAGGFRSDYESDTGVSNLDEYYVTHPTDTIIENENSTEQAPKVKPSYGATGANETKV